MTAIYISDGIDTVDLNAPPNGNEVIMGFVPRAAAEGKETVTETCRVFFKGPLATAEAQAEEAERLLLRAGRSSRPVFVHLVKNTDGGIWRSEIVSGRPLEYAADSLEVNRRNSGTLEAALIWERKGYWEGPEVTLFTGEEVNNDEAGSRSNDLLISTSLVTGKLSTPAILKIENITAGGAPAITALYIGHNVNSQPATFDHWLQGEAGVTDTLPGPAGGYDQASATSSDGFYKALLWTTDVAEGILTWTLDASLLNDARGQRFRVLMRTAVDAGGIEMRLRIENTGLTVWTGTWVRLSGYLHDLGAVQLPPFETRTFQMVPLNLVLDVRNTGGGNTGIDYIQLTPLDSFRWFVPPTTGYTFAAGTTLVDDPGAGETHLLVGGNVAPGFMARGAPIMLEPKRQQKLYFLMDSNGGAEVDREIAVTLSFRPRRATL